MGTISFFSAYEEVGEVYDAQLSHISKLIFSLTYAEESSERNTNSNDALSLELKKMGHNYEKNIVFQVRRNDKILFVSNDNLEFDGRDIAEGFSNKLIGNSLWRFFVLSVPEYGYKVCVGEKLSIRADIIEKILASIFLPIVLIIPFIFIIAWVGLGPGLKPLLSISRAVHARSAKDLSPISLDKIPQEITPLIRAINDLMGLLDEALQKERRFTDLAAHELRTPIAVLKIQAQTALKSTNEQERISILKSHVQAANRITHMVTQLLTLARLEHIEVPKSLLSLGHITEEVIRDLLPLAEKKNVRINFDRKSTPQIIVNQDSLKIILRNIIDNAIKYSPEGKDINISVDMNDKAAILYVSDFGPGIPQEKIPRVTERFYRIAGHKEVGSGLGLSIVQRATELIDAKLMIRNKDNLEGLMVTVEFSSYTS